MIAEASGSLRRSEPSEVVVVLGVQDMRKRLGPDWSEVKLRYLAVWRNETGTWRMIAWQSARRASSTGT